MVLQSERRIPDMGECETVFTHRGGKFEALATLSVIVCPLEHPTHHLEVEGKYQSTIGC